jgi:manganese/zinc/iron transport system permease protein
MKNFRFQCSLENGLKSLWKHEKKISSFSKTVTWRLKKNGWIDSRGHLTSHGQKTAERVIRLHRLWEVYLVDYLGQKAEKVHKTAEELEHLFSPELERELSQLLENPQQDPHHQPIPPHRGDPT